LQLSASAPLIVEKEDFLSCPKVLLYQAGMQLFFGLSVHLFLKFQRQEHIFIGVQGWNKVKALEDKSYHLSPDPGKLRLVKF
jgi:hypothetical protein